MFLYESVWGSRETVMSPTGTFKLNKLKLPAQFVSWMGSLSSSHHRFTNQSFLFGAVLLINYMNRNSQSIKAAYLYKSTECNP